MLRKVVNTFIGSSCGLLEVNTESWFCCTCVSSFAQFEILRPYKADELIMNYMFYVIYTYIYNLQPIKNKRCMSQIWSYMK